MKKKNAFTLIESLAIIVILAIIAVITVPIILNIIEDSQKGAVKDSAYGYKDAINKFYVSKLAQDKDFEMEDATYTTTELKNLGVSLSGKEPNENSWVIIENNDITNGCLQFDEYKVDIENGKVTTTEKGECGAPKTEICPGCKFIYTIDILTIGTSQVPAGATDDYTELISDENSYPFFLGLIANPNTNVIERAFACGIEGTTPFCLEGYDTTKWSNEGNIGILNRTFEGCNAPFSDHYASCYGSTVDADMFSSGSVSVKNTDSGCYVSDEGTALCGGS